MVTDGESGDGPAADDAEDRRARPRPRRPDNADPQFATSDAARVDLAKSAEPQAEPPVEPPAEPPASEDAPFDPYRFGKPDFPVPPEFAPPGYVPDPPPVAGLPPYPGPPRPGPAGAYPYAGGPGTGSYGADAPYPPYAPLPYQQSRSSGKAVAALACGIGSIVLSFLSFLDGILVVLAVIFGIIALNEIRSRGLTGKGMAVAGLICAAVGAALAITLTALFIRAYNQCGGSEQQHESGFQQCVQRNVF